MERCFQSDINNLTDFDGFWYFAKLFFLFLWIASIATAIKNGYNYRYRIFLRLSMKMKREKENAMKAHIASEAVLRKNSHICCFARGTVKTSMVMTHI